MEKVEKMQLLEEQRPRIFLSGSIRGGRQLIDTYRLIYDILEETGAKVLCWHVVDPELEKKEMEMTEAEIYSRDMGLLAQSDALVAEVTVPSTGVGYEICRALEKRIPVLCLYRKDATVSAMVLGNPDPFINVLDYQDENSLRKIISNFIQTLQDIFKLKEKFS